MDEQDDMQGWHYEQQLEQEFLETQKEDKHGTTTI